MTIFSQATAEGPATARTIEATLRARIADHTLAAGERLPPIREAAWQLRCAPATVARAYRALVVAGLAHGEVGRGTFVGGPDRRSAFPPRATASTGDEAGIVDLAVNGFQMHDATPLVGAAFERATARLAAGAVPAGYAAPAGREEDRVAAARFLARWRPGLAAREVVITHGAQSALSAVFQALAGRGGGIACDAVTYPGIIGAAVALGIPLYPVAGDEDGMRADALEAVCARHPVSLAVVMPDVQNPTGVSMPQARRADLASVAVRQGLTIVEDRIYGFLVPDAPEGFSGIAPERTVLVYGLSKSVAPVLRVGYVAGSVDMIRHVEAVLNATSLMVSPLLADAASWVLEQPGMETRCTALRAGIARRADCCRTRFPGLDADRLSGGIAWLPLPGDWTADGFAAEAASRGVRVSPARHFCVEPRNAPQAVRLCLANVADDTRFEAGLEVLASLLSRDARPARIAP
ncbi:PLP-dependent aminotransferase family protein [Stappia stellulata]|uniref:aminotransferase-like domain-containing protein n=1 Tax=Stappia stellulata TaxID=71235 RepID=UPI0004223A62|nr:PLP-dependent aminotransferase family protein [Stappia stellulata]